MGVICICLLFSTPRPPTEEGADSDEGDEEADQEGDGVTGSVPGVRRGDQRGEYEDEEGNDEGLLHVVLRFVAVDLRLLRLLSPRYFFSPPKRDRKSWSTKNEKENDVSFIKGER